MLLQKKQRNVCYNFFESLYSFAHFKCKGYILCSKLLLQWAVRKKKFFPSAKLKKILHEIFKYHIEKKNVSIIFDVRRQKKKIFRRKKNFDCKSPMKWPICRCCHVEWIFFIFHILLVPLWEFFRNFFIVWTSYYSISCFRILFRQAWEKME